MLSVCRLFGHFRIILWGSALFLWLCLFCYGPLFAQAIEQEKPKNTAVQALRNVAGKLLAVQLACNQANPRAVDRAESHNSSSSTELSDLPQNTEQSGQSGQSGQFEQSGQSGQSEQSGQSGQSGMPEGADPTELDELAQAVQPAEQVAPIKIEWEVLEDGLENTLVSVLPMQNATQAVNINVLRIEPEKWDFELLTASEYGRSKSLWQWAQEHKLVAAINASMYLPDAKTSTGYMRRGEHINNGRIVTNFGAFFVAMPDNDGLPQAAVLDRNDDNWQDELGQYQIVVQNYRLMTSQGKPLWGPDLLSSLAAIGQDKFGRILFLHCGQPISAIDFVEGLTRMPLDIVRLMYVEGGHQAAMLVDTKVKNQVWTGKYAALLDSNSMPPLPNVIGVKHKLEKRVLSGDSNTNSTIE